MRTQSFFFCEHQPLLRGQAQLLKKVIPLHEDHRDECERVPHVKFFGIIVHVEPLADDDSDEDEHDHEGDRGPQDAKPQGAQKHVGKHPDVQGHRVGGQHRDPNVVLPHADRVVDEKGALEDDREAGSADVGLAPVTWTGIFHEKLCIQRGHRVRKYLWSCPTSPVQDPFPVNDPHEPSAGFV